jgi:hypothetical protein
MYWLEKPSLLVMRRGRSCTATASWAYRLLRNLSEWDTLVSVASALISAVPPAELSAKEKEDPDQLVLPTNGKATAFVSKKSFASSE